MMTVDLDININISLDHVNIGYVNINNIMMNINGNINVAVIKNMKIMLVLTGCTCCSKTQALNLFCNQIRHTHLTRRRGSGRGSVSLNS